MGANWTHSYNISLTVDGSGTVGIKQADGHQDYYAPAGGGAFTPQTRGLFNTSQDPYSGPMGANWTHSYNISLTVDGSGTVGIKQADGHQDYYAPAGGGTF